jgi:hypothetical protein
LARNAGDADLLVRDCAPWSVGGLSSGGVGRRGVELRPWRVGFRGRFPCLLGCDSAGKGLVGALGVVDHVELVDLLLQFLDRVGEWLLVEPAEQSLMESFVLSDGQPPRCLLMRGRASIEIVEGVPQDYIDASLKTQSARGAEDFEGGVRAMYDSKARITIEPTWARLNDLATTLPKEVERLLARKN